MTTFTRVALFLLYAFSVLGADRRVMLAKAAERASTSSGGSSVSASDTFNRSDVNPINSPMSDGVSTWGSAPASASAFQISGNSATPIGAAGLQPVASPTFTANQLATVTLCCANGFAETVGPMVRIQPGSGSGYLLSVDSLSSIRLYAVSDTGTLGFSAIGAAVMVSLTTGDRVGLGVSGTTLTIYVNEVSQGTRTDSTYASGQPGIFANISHYIDAFSATNAP